MTTRADTHTRIVNTLKVTLPLAALAILSTLFFFSSEVDPTQSIPYAELNIAELVREQRGTAPYFAGVTDDGVAVTLTGTTALPDPTNDRRVTMAELDARFVTPGGESVELVAPLAELDSGLNTANLLGGVTVSRSDGVTLKADELLTDMATGRIESLGPITGDGPFGTLSANSMVMERPSPDAAHTIIFQGNVEVIYLQPGGER